MSFADKVKERIRSGLIESYERNVRDIVETTGYSEEYVRKHLMWEMR